MKIHGAVVCAATAAMLFSFGCGSDKSDGSPGSKAGTGGLAGTSSADSAGEGGSVDGDSAGAAGADDTPNASGGNGGNSGNGGSNAKGGAGGSGGATAGSGGASAGSGGQPQLGFASDPAGVALELAPTSTAGLTLTSSRITQEATSSLNYVEWYAELHNGTSSTQCLIEISADFQTGAGVSIIKFDGYATGAAYKLTDSKLSSPCMAPGESVPVWTNDLPDSSLALASIQKVIVDIQPLTVPDAVLHPATPTLGTVTKTYSSTLQEWALSGSATATADIYNASITFWGKSGKFYVDNTKVFHLDDLLKGQAWTFSTTGGLKTVTLDSVVSQFSFITGLQEASANKVYIGQVPALEARLTAAGKQWNTAVDRRSRFRTEIAGK